jgi:hypothetical protein
MHAQLRGGLAGTRRQCPPACGHLTGRHLHHLDKRLEPKARDRTVGHLKTLCLPVRLRAVFGAARREIYACFVSICEGTAKPCGRVSARTSRAVLASSGMREGSIRLTGALMLMAAVVWPP